jgi:hypothetical protein
MVEAYVTFDAFTVADVACCILNGANIVVAEFGWTPTASWVAAKGGDNECCGSLVLVPGDSFPFDGNDPKCANLRTYGWTLEASVCVDESIVGCRDAGTCCDLPEQFNPCQRTRKVSKMAESRWLMGLRAALERNLETEIGCCLKEAVSCTGERLKVMCRRVHVGAVSTITEGACHFILVELETDF